MKLSLPLYLLSSATSLFGNSIIVVVLPWLVLERTGDPAVAGLVAAASAVPSALATLVGGHLIDKVGRRTICVISDAGSAISVAALAIVDGVFGLNVGWFITLGILGALFDVPGMTARQTLMADVSRSSGVAVDKVAAAESTLLGVSMLAGPALAGWLLAVSPTIQVVWVTAACSAVATATIAVMPLLPSERATSGAATDDGPLAGWRLIRASRPLLALVVISLASMVLVAPLLSVILPAHFRVLGHPEQLGLTLSAYAIGTMAGSGIYAAVFAQRRWASWVTSNVLYAASFAIIATLNGFWLVGAGMMVAGIAAGLMQPIGMVVLTQQVPEHLRGRVFALFSALSMVASPVGLGLMAALLAGADLRMGAVAIAVGWVPVLVYSIVAPGLRDYIRSSQTPSEEAVVADH